MTRYVIVHERDGVFVGYAMGFAFFSALDPAGQTHAVAFNSRDDAYECCRLLSFETLYRIEPIQSNATHATIEELEAAGYGRYLDLMKAERLRNMQPAGRA